MSPIRTAKLEDGSYLVDVRGWMCPYPKYMLEPLLRKLEAVGGRLVLLVDCPSAATDVPALAHAQGHTVPEVSQISDGEWRITIDVGVAPSATDQR